MNENIDLEKLDRYLAVETRSTVLIGDFSPIIFQPYWLSSKGIIRDDEANNAKVDVIVNDLSQFKIGEWLDVTVTRNKCQLKTRLNPYFPVIKDVAEHIFKLLSENSIRAIGLNYIYSLTLVNEDKYYHLGKELASLSRWDSIMDKPKLGAFSIKGATDENECITTLTINPTDNNLKINFGVDLNINNHFALENNKSNGLNASKLINERFESYSIRSKIIANKVIKEFIDNE